VERFHQKNAARARTAAVTTTATTAISIDVVHM
jgi:hypothetical protein